MIFISLFIWFTFIFAMMVVLKKALPADFLLLSRWIRGESYVEDRYIGVAKKNIEKLWGLDLSRVKVLYVDRLESRGLYSPLSNVILIKEGVFAKQHVIEHELLHSVDRSLGITGTNRFKSMVRELVDFNRSEGDRLSWILGVFPKADREASITFLREVEEKRGYWLSDDELFVSFNNLLLYMFKRCGLKRGEGISEECLSKLFGELWKEDIITKYDFFVVLPYLRWGSINLLMELCYESGRQGGLYGEES